jgi:hypothetical protein
MRSATDLIGRAGAIVAALDGGDADARRAVFPEVYWGWADDYVARPDGWALVDELAGAGRRVAASRALSPHAARLVLEGEAGQAVVTVSIDGDGKVAGFALDPEEFEGIGTIVIACPDERRQELGGFYDAVLGHDPRRLPRLGFGEGRGYRPPRWRDPAAPAQIHLDIAGVDEPPPGAVLLAEFDGHRVFSDPVGHPFCLTGGEAGPRIHRIVIDCARGQGEALASFYRRLLARDPRLPLLAFQEVEGYAPPRWPDPAYPAQAHFDLKFDDRPAAERVAVEAGARPLTPQGGSCPVYADPAGHPFCLCMHGE